MSVTDTRIRQCLDTCGQNNRTALVSFITAGDPGPGYTVAALHSLVAGGVDILELGIPFSDPEAEGPSIQAANERALAHGITLAQVLQMVEEFRTQDTQTPVVLMGYLNSVLAMDDFAERAAGAGVDGLIMVNLPPEEGDHLQQNLAANNIDLIYLLAPTTTDERARQIAAKASGFIYYVSLKGITGASHLQTDEVASRFKVDKESQFTVIKGGKHLTRGMNLEDAVVLKEDMLHVIIKETTDGHVSSRTRSRTSARASTS